MHFNSHMRANSLGLFCMGPKELPRSKRQPNAHQMLSDVNVMTASPLRPPPPKERNPALATSISG